MSERILGFKEKDAQNYQHFLAIDIHKLVPVVSKEIFNERVRALQLALAERDAAYKQFEELKKKSVLLEWLEKEIESAKQQGSWKAFLEFAEKVKAKKAGGG